MACITHSVPNPSKCRLFMKMNTMLLSIYLFASLQRKCYVYLTRVCIITLTYIYPNFDFWHYYSEMILRTVFVFVDRCLLYGWCVMFTDNNSNWMHAGSESNSSWIALVWCAFFNNNSNNLIWNHDNMFNWMRKGKLSNRG